MLLRNRHQLAQAAVALLVIGICVAQNPKAAYNKRFVVERSVVAPLASEIAPVGPIELLPDRTMSIPGKVGLRSLSLHVTVVADRDSPSWELQVKNLFGALEDVITSDSERAVLGEFWTADVLGPGALVHLTTKSTAGAVRATIDSYSYPVKPSAPQGIVGEDRRQKIRDLGPSIQGAGRPIARVRIKSTRGEALCTGFLVSNDLLLTNFHCIATKKDAANSWADFAYEEARQRFKTYKVKGLELINYKEELDYALVRVADKPGQTFGFVQLGAVTTDRPLAVDHKLLLIQHPAGEPKQVSIDGCDVASDPVPGIKTDVTSDFRHNCDTLSGSSGSPVLDLKSFRVLGLHHMGYEEERRKTAKRLKDLPLQNQAVYIGAIVADIQDQSDLIAQELGLSKRPTTAAVRVVTPTEISAGVVRWALGASREARVARRRAHPVYEKGSVAGDCARRTTFSECDIVPNSH